ncbi:hypothetical protein IAE39_005842 [Pseudomonas sp. S37]|uniref:hypothetical protein n=1 Tax=Pseudomonas sp. S37 TaxID=2767449 RepID=UPI001911FA05|nr:hypothetical protein [Pseudomonas sp. S37]MBK4997668.1 hypothetical protein [Pseudomonas sp. S37]
MYLARFLDFSTRPSIAYIIASLICLAAIITATSIYYNCRAFTGSEYNRPPYARELRKYHEQQIEYNSQVKEYNASANPTEKIPLIDPEQETHIFITKTYIDCATHNALRNEDRSRLAFKAFSALLVACIPLANASLLFVVFDMDTSSPRKNLAIKDTYVGDQITALREQLAISTKHDDIANLEKRTIILESIVSELKETQLSESKERKSTEQPPNPQPPMKPSAPPHHMAYDDSKGGSNRNPK